MSSKKFSRFAKTAARYTGHPAAFLSAVALVVVWAVTGPIFQFNQTWQLVINTGTTIITFLMVFLIQNSQNRDTAALQIKIDELVRATAGASDSLLDLEELEEEELEMHRQRFLEMAKDARGELRKRKARK